VVVVVGGTVVVATVVVATDVVTRVDGAGVVPSGSFVGGGGTEVDVVDGDREDVVGAAPGTVEPTESDPADSLAPHAAAANTSTPASAAFCITAGRAIAAP
jgi:hypothetical protein